ncbi:MAG TPA: MBL fold metallo-hydrolase, partial [Chloroflexi bacterium]|nr:MBL fold metallo-hydrolase [Chloroflexota bacterium]
MSVVEVRPGIYWIGVNDRTTDLFEGLWPITDEGVSYNAYVVKGEKNALIDLARDIKSDALIAQISRVVDPAALDYIVINHMEPDHTGVIRTLRRMAPEATVLCTRQAVPMLKAFYGVEERVRVVEDGEIVDLGLHSLQFFMTPMVHWPETMMTFEMSQRVLFSCDAFG